MRKLIRFFLLSALITSYTWGQTSISPEIQSKLRNSVFEVVIDKIEDKNITYEKPLPFDKLPYAIRTDKFSSIGTAFLLDNGTFWSASHVFNLYDDSVHKDFYIRDSKGKTYKVNQITNLSTTRDFISFTVPDFIAPENAGLPVSKEYELNTAVYSVGNAQGEGIVIRDGMLTSQTPEDLNGEWNWLRFSAAANPGNSGGPLVNSEGAVIGIVTMKNKGENLNYALPIKEIEAGNGKTGCVDTRFYYRLPNILNYKEYNQFSYTVNLPAVYSNLHEELTKAYKEHIKKTVESIRKSYNPDAPKGFANSQEYPDLTYNSYCTDSPLTVFLNASGVWDFGSASSNTYQLDDNGSIEYCSLLNYYAFTITKPDNLPLEKLINDPKWYMDRLLKLLNLYRSVGQENVSITSLGNPCDSTTYEDYFGRTWLVNYYSLDFCDSMIITYALPLPTGLYVLYKLDSRSEVTSCHYLDMGFMADHTYTSYYGQLKDWFSYLELIKSGVIKAGDLISQFKLEKSENQFSFSNGELSLTLNENSIPYSDDSRINVRTGYTKKDGKTVLENRGFIVYSNPNALNYKYISIRKIRKPLLTAAKKLQEHWSQVKSKVSPFNGEPYNHEQFTYMDTIIFPNDNPESEVLYELGFEIANPNKNEEIKALGQETISNIKF